MLQGAVELKYEDKKYALSAGDCFYLDGRMDHSFVNESDEPALLLAVFFDYRRF